MLALFEPGGLLSLDLGQQLPELPARFEAGPTPRRAACTTKAAKRTRRAE
jgi:hypothetical protein